VQTMERRYGRADRIWVGDRGMASADNIAFLKQSGRRYIVGTPKSMLKQFERELLADVVLPTRAGPDIRRRCVTQPTDHQSILLAHLKLNLPTLPLTDGA